MTNAHTHTTTDVDRILMAVTAIFLAVGVVLVVPSIQVWISVMRNLVF